MDRGGVASVAVPIFFIISGFFLGQHINEDGWYGRAVKKRVKTLVIPFYVLQILWFPIFYGVHYVGVKYMGADGSDCSMDFTWFNFFFQTSIIPWGGTIVLGLWYVKALFLLVLISPILVYIAKKNLVIGLFGVSLLLTFWCVQMGIISNFSFPAKRLFSFELCFRCWVYFLIGLLLSQHKLEVNWVQMRWAVIPIAVLLLFIIKTIDIENRSLDIILRFVFTMFMGMAIWSVVPTARWPKALTGNSFAIFVLHGMVLYLLPIGFRVFGVWDSVFKNFGGALLFFVVIAVAIFIAEVVKRRFVGLAKLIFGGR